MNLKHSQGTQNQPTDGWQTGMQDSAHGSESLPAKGVSGQTHAPALTPERAAEGLERLTHSLPLLRENTDARAWAIQALPYLEGTMPHGDAVAISLVALEPYFSKDTPQSVKKAEASMWADALGKFPAWAVKRAIYWWQSADNPDRRRRPVFGDIEARARIEVAPLRAARTYLDMGTIDPEPPRPVVTPEEQERRREAAQRITEQMGYAPTQDARRGDDRATLALAVLQRLIDGGASTVDAAGQMVADGFTGPEIAAAAEFLGIE